MMLTVAYYAHKYHWGGDIAFDVGAARQGAARARHRDRLSARRSGALFAAGLPFNCARSAPASLACSRRTAKFKFDAVLPIMTPVLLIGGMTTGVFTPTEGAIAACVWALFLASSGTAR